MFKSKKININIIVIILIMLVPLIFKNNNYIILIMCMIGIYIIAISGLDLLFGYTGQISLGHAAFYAIGAYSSALLAKMGVPPFLSIPIAGFMAAFAGIIIAFPASKLLHHFLALMTIAFNILVYHAIANILVNLTGGHVGLIAIPAFKIGNFVFAERLTYFYVILFYTLLSLLVKQRIVYSRTGRAFIAIRENYHAANGLGVNVHYYKMLAFLISALFTGVAGALYAHMVRYISPDTFTFNQSVLFLIMLLFGGPGSLSGPIMGVVTLLILAETLQKFTNIQMLIYGIFLLVIIIFLPGGVYGLFRNIRLTKKMEVKADAETK